MILSASINNSGQQNEVTIAASGQEKRIEIPSKSTGNGSAASGGELLMLAIATCFCNDIYREAAKRSMQIDRVFVSAKGNFPAEGEAAESISYSVEIEAPQHSAEEINNLVHLVDELAEVHKTLRQGIAIHLESTSKD